MVLEDFYSIKSNLDRFHKSYVEVGGDWTSRYEKSKNLINNLIYTKK